MEKIFKNKTFVYIITGVLMVLQLSMSIVRWNNGGFNGGSLFLCLSIIGLLACTAIGIIKKYNFLMIIAGIAILSIFIYVKSNDVSGFVLEASKGTIPLFIIVVSTFVSLGTLFLICSLIFAIAKAFGLKKDLRLINAVLCIIASVCFIIPVFAGISVDASPVVNLLSEILFSTFLPLLVASLGYHVDINE